MFQWAKDWAVDKIYGVAKTGIEATGTMAGDAVGGVGCLIENSGRSIGNSASGSSSVLVGVTTDVWLTGLAGAVGGVGNYINSYGNGIKNSMAASGGGNEGKKTAVKKEAPKTAQKAVTSTTKSVPYSAPRSLPAPTTRTPSPKNPLPSNPPRATNRNLPAKKPTPQPARPNLPKISSSAADRTPDGKVRISPASRPKSNIANGANGPKPVQNGGRPLPKISAGKNDRTPDGKVRISAASRPAARPVVRAH